MHVTEFHHIGHESVLREDEDTILSSKSHVKLPKLFIFSDVCSEQKSEQN